jgi:hypothetical protein
MITALSVLARGFMDITLGSHVMVKLFLGSPLTSELKMHLNHSDTWKQAVIMRGHEKNLLQQTQYHKKTYMGLYADEEELTLQQIRMMQQLIYDKLHLYCPKIQGLEKMPLYLFPQLFVA